MLETMGYGFNALLEKNSSGQPGGLAALDSTLILRGILVPAGHVAWTGAICAALWAVAEAKADGRSRVWPVLRLVLVHLAAIVLHTLWDASSSLMLHVLIGVVSVGSLLWLTIHAHRADVRRALSPPG
ncbi:PrsW family glutamic-type intramembrane protease [Aestuariimicrobium soli]|uniref:PrsW family glutamic-type intramembrane protease n=1 Tax=Aestuariimicrobium soli TaxID=2035834 RepID=UPI003EBE6ED0